MIWFFEGVPMPCVVILTALSVEYQAVRSYLVNPQKEVNNPQGSIYERGKFTANAQDWDVGIAEVGTGNTNAHRETEWAITYFNPDIIFFVGIAGGIKDVEIGDVVVATKVYYYESVKVEDEDVSSRPELEKSHSDLVKQAKYEADSKQWLRCCPNTSELKPRVFVAPIASGEKVIAAKNTDTFRFLRKHYNDAIAVEMEGFGFLRAVSAYPNIKAIVIRGVSDLIDYKNDSSIETEEIRQEKASIHASVFAFGLLSKLDYLNQDICEIFKETNQQIYVERPPIEDKCYRAIMQSGALIRIKAPKKMGKTLLLEKILVYSRLQGYKTVKVDLNLADNSVTTDYKSFLHWLCANASDSLDLENKVDEYWQDRALGLNTNCSRYFQKYLLPMTNTSLVIAIDNFERLFQHTNIFSDFCLLLRNWYETAKQGDKMGQVWKQLRLVVVNSTELYPKLDINRSPFNVGESIELLEFNQKQVREMANLLGVRLSDDGLVKLINLLGGHPYLLQKAIDSLKNKEQSLEQLMNL
jgi:nucleoside phosphorylase